MYHDGVYAAYVGISLAVCKEVGHSVFGNSLMVVKLPSFCAFTKDRNNYEQSLRINM